MAALTLEETAKAEQVIKCEQQGCHQEFPEKDAHYLPGVACPSCYDT